MTSNNPTINGMLEVYIIVSMNYDYIISNMVLYILQYQLGIK